MKRPLFSKGELKFLTESPEALRALADMHEIWATEADAMDFNECVPYHDNRKKELNEIASFVEASREEGEYPTFETVSQETTIEPSETCFEDARGAISSFLCWHAMIEAQWMLDAEHEPKSAVSDSAPLISFMGSGASTTVTVGEVRAVAKFLNSFFSEGRR